MKALPWILVILLSIAWLMLYFRPQPSMHTETIRDTIVRIDTLRDTVPVPVKEKRIRIDTVYLPVLVGDTVSNDSVAVTIPITQKEYQTEQYRAWVSGYHPNLDSIETYIPTNTIYVHEKVKAKRWGISIQAGYGVCKYGFIFYGGVGLSFSLSK